MGGPRSHGAHVWCVSAGEGKGEEARVLALEVLTQGALQLTCAAPQQHSSPGLPHCAPQPSQSLASSLLPLHSPP